jgi:hypothetical protein
VVYAILELQKRISEESGVLTSQERHRGAWVRGRYGKGQTPKSRILQGTKEGS